MPKVIPAGMTARAALGVLLGGLLAAFLFSAPAAHGATIAEITAALDSADEPAEFASQAALLESACEKAGPAGRAPALTQLARAYYLMGEAETGEKRRLSLLDDSIKAAEAAISSGPDNPRALYWLCMAKLQKADIVGPFKALGLVKDALSGLDEVASKDELYDDAGALRSRGKVLMEAPAWALIGDKKEGMRLLARAKEIAPDALINRLYLAEAYAAEGMEESARAELEYIVNAPVGKLKPKDDEKTKKDAMELLGKMGRWAGGGGEKP